MRNWVMAAATLVLTASLAHAQPATDPRTQSGVDAFEGVWSNRVDMGPALRGELTVAREEGEWRASVGGVEAQASTLDITFPSDGGRLRGVLSYDQRAIDAWWIQPPGLPGVAYATPVRLRAEGGDRWRGEVSPLPQTFTMHLRVFQREDGAWLGAFRNPEFNMNAGASRFLANLGAGGRILFQTPAGETVREAQSVEGRLHLAWPPLPQPLELTRNAERAPGCWPRLERDYSYAAPPRLRDGWRVAPARRVGFDEAALARTVRAILENDPGAQRPALVHSILVARHGRLVLEEYFFGYDRDTPHDLRSAGKTFASLLLGAAMRDGAGLGPDSRLYETLGVATSEPRRADITLAHLMTHTSGLDCDDNNENSPGNEGAMQGQQEQPDWWRFALDLPMAHAPGSRYAYCTAGMNLVGAALRHATGEGVPELFDRTVARPLGFGLYHWNLMPSGEGYLGGGVYMRPRDLAKIGQLYLDGGVWSGRRVLDRSWVEQSTAPHVDINETTTGMDAERFANVATRGADGYAWHRYGVRVGDRRVDSYEASGNGGQLLIVVPAYDLVVVITGGNYGQGAIWTRWRDEIVGGQVIAALRQ
jgi:CubicO group peptidase (beta-lactamase class C family)